MRTSVRTYAEYDCARQEAGKSGVTNVGSITEDIEDNKPSREKYLEYISRTLYNIDDKNNIASSDE
jgi:hypothetical protein